MWLPRLPWLVWLLALAALDVQAQYDPAQARPAMQQIFASLRTVLPLAVQDGALADPANDEAVRRALAALVKETELLDDHGKGFDAGARFVARSLASDAHQAKRHFDRAEHEASEFFLLQMAEACVACHSRLPSAKDSPIAAGFFDTAELAELPVAERARLQIATRRFDAALDSLETALRSPEIPPVELLDPLVDYLTVCVRVKRDFARPIPTLVQFAGRSDLWLQLRDDARAWIEYLPELGAREPAKDELQEARELIHRGRNLIVYPSDRRALIHYLVASSMLHRIVATRRDASPEVAEAYYLLGAVESRIGRGFWISPAGFYLEMAVRLAPESETGRRAFALLEEELYANYSGSGGENLPSDERAKLEELKRLVRAGEPGGT